MTDHTVCHIDGVHTVGIPVSDQDRAVAFYRDVLGFEIRLDAPIPQLGSRWIEAAPAGAPVSVALTKADGTRPGGGETGIRLATTDAAAAHTHLRDAGVDAGELLSWPGVPPMFTFSDPDGNGLTVVQAPADGSRGEDRR